MALGSLSSSFNYDVFLSFRGEDTRHGFTGHLYKALHSKGIHTFIDDEELQRGEQITPALMKAIQESRVAVTVLSEDYASSSFCLDELATILHCHQRKRLSVIPVFYKVDPSDVRHQKGSYGVALAKLERRFQDDPEKLQKWKMALQQVADLSGYHFKDGDEYEYKFIEKIVEQVSRVINLCHPLPVAEYPVGLKSRVSDVRKLLDAGSDEGVNMVGIHGMGGIGKSTLALAVYNELIIDEMFDGLCFLANVRENSNKHGLEYLQKNLLSKIIGENINLTSKEQGISIIKSRLRGKKVLLILDDVDTRKQLQAIAGRPDWFGLGSKIIITTRDQKLLASHEVNKTYQVTELNENDALQLLTWNAFKKDKADPTYEEVLCRAVTFASGLPLALNIIGSHLFGKSIEEWESAIKQYKRIPEKEIFEILKVSFDALEEEEKSVFLDIACCLKERKRKEVEHILGCLYDDCMKHHIGVLVEKSLIQFRWCDEVNMHDLIQDMGRRIDQQQSSKEPGKRRRLWLTKDIIQVLEDNSGSCEIEIICLDFSSLSEKEATIEWNGNAFKKMKNLKILIIRYGQFSKGPNYFPESLRVLEWHRYPSNCLPSNFNPKELVICKLPHSCITSFGFHGSRKKFGNLKVLNFDESEFLREIPDVSDLPNLEELSFDRCRNLITVHPSIGFLNKLKELSGIGCNKLTTLPPLNLPSLKTLNLSKCSSLEKFPEILGEMKNLLTLTLFDLNLKEWPVSFQNLVGLQSLYLHKCDIGRFPSSIVVMPELSIVNATNCKGWQWVKSEKGEEKVGSRVCSNGYKFTVYGCNLYDDFFSTGFMQLDHVGTLSLVNNNFTFLPECFKEFQFLRRLDVSGCLHLQEIRGVPPNLKDFSARECISLSSSSSTSMLLNQKLHEAGQTVFRFPGATIPEWFKQKSRGPSSSFWFRNEFPDNVLCLLIARVECKPVINFQFHCPMPKVFINGKLHEIPNFIKPNSNTIVQKVKLYYTYLLDLRPKCRRGFEVALEKEWNHVEITYAGVETSVVKSTGIHVLRQDDIRYDDPDGKRKLDHDLNNSESQPHIKKHRQDDIRYDDPDGKRKLDHALNNSESQPHIKKHRISRWVGPERIRKLLWKAAEGALIFNDERRYRHMSMDSSCRRCGVLEETCLHALRDCPDVAAFWRSVLPVQLQPMFFNGDVTVWLETNLSFSEAAVFWPTFFGIAVEWLWEFRNDLVFYQEYRVYDPRSMNVVFNRYNDFMRGHASHNLMTRNLLMWRGSCHDDHGVWLLRLSVSGAFDPSSGTAACGGIFRAYYVPFVLGYSVKVGECCSKDEAEIWGIYHGIKIAWQYDIWAVYRHILSQDSIPIHPGFARKHDFGKIWVESGSQKAIEFVVDGCPTSASTSASRSRSRSLQHCFPLCAELQALTSAANHFNFFCRRYKAAESLAEFGLSMKEQASIFDACPPCCNLLFL